MERTAEQSLDEVASALLGILPVGVVVTDENGSAQFANREWTAMSSQAGDEWRPFGWLHMLDAELRSRRLDEILTCCGNGGTYSAEWTVNPSSETRTWHVVARPLVMGDRVDRIVIAATDVSEQRADTTDLAFQATHDQLTGLYNRSQFTAFVERALDRRVREPWHTAAVVFVDVDDLKATNDSFGHAAGDRVLQTVATRIEGAVRPEDVVARYGGDEFAVLCEALRHGDEAAAIADRIRTSVLQLYDGDGWCGASVGIAMADGHHDVVDLMSAADRAMYRAKRKGRAYGEDVAIVDDLLYLDKVGHDAGPVDKVDLGDVVAAAIETAPPPRHLSLVVDSLRSGPPLCVRAHHRTLVRAVVHLLANAYHYAEAHVIVTIGREGTRVSIVVEDDGPGVPSNGHRVLDLSTRSAEGTSRGIAGGTGLGVGLSIAKQSVRAIGGDLRFTAREPHGARFTISLPDVQPAGPHPSA